MTRLVMGVGVNDRSCPAKLEGKTRKEYVLWNNMLNRCYNAKYHEAKPTYIGCSVSEKFKHYSYFYDWCQLQVGFGIIDFHLDKDLLLKHNKIYSEDKCVFIPKDLNMLLIKRQLYRGDLPIGVAKSGNNYSVKCRAYGAVKCIGTFNTYELAFNAYKTFKEAHIKELAEKYKDNIDPRAYKALMNYEVSIDD